VLRSASSEPERPSQRVVNPFVSPFVGGCALRFMFRAIALTLRTGLRLQPLTSEQTRRALIRIERDQQIPTMKAVGGLRLNQGLKEAGMISAAALFEVCSR
jgi:hypothetical protein